MKHRLLPFLLGALLLAGCATASAPIPPPPPFSADAPETLARQVRSRGTGLSFINEPSSIPAGATKHEAGARFVYDRSHSANARKSPMSLIVWVQGEAGEGEKGKRNQDGELYLDQMG